jgi:hypothetical protein
MKTQTPFRCDALEGFIARHEGEVIGHLHGADRLRLQGTLPSLYRPGVMEEYLWRQQVLFKDFKSYAAGVTKRMRAGLEANALMRQRPVIYLQTRGGKEERARQVAAEEGITEGVVCVLSAQETGQAYEACPNHQTRRLEMRLREKRCVYIYVYLLHAALGFMHVRFQTWFPFLVQIWINGREWLARQMTQAGLGFRRARNCFTWLEDAAAAQALMDRQWQTDWPTFGKGLVAELNPLAAEVLAPLGLEYYWTTPETEYASDVMFRDPVALSALYPSLVHHGITSLGCREVMRFLGRATASTMEGEVGTTLQTRPEGVCLKHRVKANSLKAYNKEGSVLRVEVTINEPEHFRVLRPPTGQPDAPKKWRELRRTTADLFQRAQISHTATERYYAALSVVDLPHPLAAEVAGLCRRVRWHGQSFRALNPLAAEDGRLLTIISNAQYTLQGLTNAELREALYGPAQDPHQRRRQAARITRLIRLLRAHHLLHKMPRVHRYQVPTSARRILCAVLAARCANVDQLVKLAA